MFILKYTTFIINCITKNMPRKAKYDIKLLWKMRLEKQNMILNIMKIILCFKLYSQKKNVN